MKKKDLLTWPKNLKLATKKLSWQEEMRKKDLLTWPTTIRECDSWILNPLINQLRGDGFIFSVINNFLYIYIYIYMAKMVKYPFRQNFPTKYLCLKLFRDMPLFETRFSKYRVSMKNSICWKSSCLENLAWNSSSMQDYLFIF